MFDEGLIEEARELAHKYPQATEIPNSPINSPGYKQALAHLRGDLALRDAIISTQQAHRNYAKRQLTWFRGLEDVRWFEGFGDDPEIERRVLALVRGALSPLDKNIS
jgi:tRNA dimethylallyltransferase